MPLARRVLLFSFAYLASCCFGQVSSPTQPSATTATTSTSAQMEMPSDPAALLNLGAKKNGLQNVQAAPWHMKATYQVLDERGSAKETGTFEEFWVSDTKVKVSYSGPGVNQTLYLTKDGGFRVGDQKLASGDFSAARYSLSPFFPSDELLKMSKVDSIDKQAGSLQLRCVTLDTSKPGLAGFSEIYCFSLNAPILRMYETSAGANQNVYNGIVSFEGIYVAHDVSVSWQGKPRIKIHVDTLERFSNIDESNFTPPPEALPLKQPRIDVAGSVIAGRIIRKVTPEYPEALRSVHLQGTVVLQAVIKKDGTVGDLTVISGPKPFYPSAIAAVSQWVYEPYLLYGEPVQVSTTINVIFGLGGPGRLTRNLALPGRPTIFSERRDVCEVVTCLMSAGCC